MYDVMNSVVNSVNPTKPIGEVIFNPDFFSNLNTENPAKFSIKPLTETAIEMIAETMNVETKKISTGDNTTLNFRASNIDGAIVINVLDSDDKVIFTIPNEKIREMVISMQENMKGGKDLGILIDMLV